MIEAFHLEGPVGKLFCVAWRPPSDQSVRFGVLCVLPFAEEANKSRRMVAEQARAFAQAGGLVLVVDLGGTGDSDGEFADARVSHWVGDLIAAWNWLCAQVHRPLWLWGIRLGAMLATRAAIELSPPPQGIVLWQPVVSGKTYMNQFLRLALAQQLGTRESSERVDPKSVLTSGSMAEVGGYELHPELVTSIEALRLDTLAVSCEHIIWLECGSSDDLSLSPSTVRCVEKWRKSSSTLIAEKIACPSFWASQEIEFSESLITRTLELVNDARKRADSMHSR